MSHRFLRRAGSIFNRVGIVSLPLCVSMGATVPTISDAPSYAQDVFKSFKDRHAKKNQSSPPKFSLQSDLPNKKTIRIGLIGAGPSGLSLLNAFNKELQRLKQENKDANFELVCFEKQDEIGGLWNYSWRAATDKYGASVHASQYRHLWSNGPKEILEMADYTFEKHFKGKSLGSFPPRPVLRDYVVGRVKENELESKFDIKFAHNIIDVKETDDDKFELIYEDLANNQSGSDTFDYVVVATGHFSVPNMVEFKGFDKFTGRILHSHSFRNAQEFKGQNILIIGSSYSAEDIALQCWKFGAKNVTISYRTAAMGFNWPDGVREVPLLKEIVNGKDAVFTDGQEVKDIDAVILCTGYMHSFPFLNDNLKLKTKNMLYPPGLFKGVVWMQNPKLMYLGMQDQWYTFTMFDTQALFAKDVILNRIQLPDKSVMIDDAAQWSAREKESNSDEEMIRFQTDYVQDLYSQLLEPQEYIDDINKLDYSEEFEQWEHDKHKDILSYRDQSFTSKISGKTATQFNTPWAEAFDDSLENYLEGCQ